MNKRKWFFALTSISMIALVGSATGCATAPTTTKPVINSFTVSPASISQGERTTLSWDVSGTTTVTIEPAIGECGPSGSLIITPDASVTYTLTATNEAGSSTSPVNLTVIPVVAGKPDLVITDIWMDGAVVYYKIKNQGNADAKPSTAYLYPFNPNTKQASDWVQPLAAGEELTQSFANFPVYFDTATGSSPAVFGSSSNSLLTFETPGGQKTSFSVKICVDAENDVDESDEGNNCTTKRPFD